VTPGNLYLYVDLGMSLFNVGEEGRVPLAELTLEGKQWVDLRKARNRFERMGAEFIVEPRESVQELLPVLRSISDEWLASKNAREKGFSLGQFDDAYLKRNPVAVLRLDGRVVAFASMWVGVNRQEFSADLMRYSSTAPSGAMDCLFANLLLWGRQEGYEYMSLGMAPLSGLEGRRLAPLWHKLGDALFDHGERFYNFRGLYEFKEKFAPEWEPRYLAVKSARHLPRALGDVTSLIGGGLKGVLAR
jgi:phosphatidylglycerol lysyltransferase